MPPASGTTSTNINADEETQGLGELVRRIQQPPRDGGCPWSWERVPREFVDYAQSELLEIEEAIALLEAALSTASTGDAEAVLTAEYFRVELAEELGDLCFDLLCLIGLVGRQFGIERSEPWQLAVLKMQERCCYVEGVGTERPLPTARTADEAMALWTQAKQVQKTRKQLARTTSANAVISRFEQRSKTAQRMEWLTGNVLPVVVALVCGTVIGRSSLSMHWFCDRRT